MRIPPHTRQHQRGATSSGPIVLLFLFLVIGAVLYLGFQSATSTRGGLADFGEDAVLDYSALELRLQQVQSELDVERTQRAMDSKALELVRQEMAVQREVVVSLEENLRFYRSLMSPQGGDNTVSLRPPELVQQEMPGQFSFRLIIQQQANKHELVEGGLQLVVSGMLDGQSASYALNEVSSNIEGPEVVLHFLYFQTLEGTLTLPEGFEPRMLSAVVTASKPRIIELKEEFPWRLQERFTNVGS